MEICQSITIEPGESETIIYNNKNFPVYLKLGKLSTYPNYSAICHWHNDLEIIYIKEGSMNYDVNGEKITLNEGEGIFINSKAFHYGYSLNKKECIFICFIFPISLLSFNQYFLENYLNSLINNKCFTYKKLNPSIKREKDILNDIENIYEFNIDVINPFNLIQKSLNIIENLFNNMNNNENNSLKNNEDIIAFTKMIGYIQKNYFNKITLRDVYLSGNVCKTKCAALFKKYLKTTVIDYINNYRLEKSTYLLENTNKSITEIAYSVGFSSTSYYCEVFSKIFKMTPKNYRNKK